MSRIIYTIDSQKELWSLLGLFESNKFVSDKLRENFKSMDLGIIDQRTENIVYSIRQAREFFESSEQVSLLTSPLLLSYGMLNLAKALVYYLSSESTDFTNHFKKHGITVPYDDNKNLLADGSIKFFGIGTYSQLSNIYGEEQHNNLEISVKEILSQIPDLGDMFVLTYNEKPRVVLLKKIDYGYSMGDLASDHDKIWFEIKSMADLYKDSGFIFESTGSYITIFQTAAATKPIEEYGIILKSISSIDFFRTIPVINGQIINLKEPSLYYLLIFCYGMLARYQATKWGKYVDPNFSKEAELISKSIIISRNRFLHLVVNLFYNEDIQFRYSEEQIAKSKREMADYVYDDVMERLNRELRQSYRAGRGILP